MMGRATEGEPYHSSEIGRLKRRSVRGAAISLASQLTKFGFQTIATVVLARLLAPADFGLIAMVSAVIGIAHMFTDLGLSEATIQRESIDQGQLSTLFWVNVGIGIVLMASAAALGPVLAWFYGEGRLAGIACVMASAFLISGLRVQHDALLKREMRYGALAARDIVSYAVGTALAVTYALRGGGYWAIICLPLAANATQMVLSWVLLGWLPGLPRRDAAVRAMLWYGGSLAAANVVGYVTRSTDSVLIGWFWGAGPLGLYSKAYNLLMLPMRQLNTPLRTVTIPAFSRIRGDTATYERYYLRAMNVLMWLGAPLMAFLFVAAESVIVIILGQQWSGCAPVFRLFAIAGIAQPLLDATEWLFVSRGRTDRLLRMATAISGPLICAIAIALPFGIEGVAFGYSMTLLVLLPCVLSFSFIGTTLTLSGFWNAVRWPLGMMLIAAAVGSVTVNAVGYTGDIERLLVILGAFVTTYCIGSAVKPIRLEMGALFGLVHGAVFVRVGSPRAD
jgi:PST family polysaccharide transporter